jgi:hypothetical protein
MVDSRKKSAARKPETNGRMTFCIECTAWRANRRRAGYFGMCAIIVAGHAGATGVCASVGLITKVEILSSKKSF